MRKLSLLAACLLTIAPLSACSSDSGKDEDAASKRSTTTTSAAPSTSSTVEVLDAGEVDSGASDYCATWADIRSAAGDESLATASADRIKAHYAKLVPLTERLLAQATAKLKGDVQKALDATRAAARSGSTASFNTPEMQAVGDHLGQYAADNCKK